MAILDVIGLGAMNLDRLYRVDEIVVDGEQVVTGSMAFPGGSAANTIYGLAKLDIKAGFIGAVGTDEEGQQLIESLGTVGADTSQIKIKEATPTGTATCISDKLGRRAIYLLPGANGSITTKDIDIHYVNQAKFVHLSSFVNQAQFSLQLNLAKKLEDAAKLSFAPGMLYAAKGIKALAPLLEKSYIAFMNRDEIEKLTGLEFRAGAKKCLGMGCRIVVVTLGKGIPMDKNRVITSYIVDAKGEYETEATKKSDSSDLETVGAGDAFAAGFLFGLLRDKSTTECGLLGNIMAQFAIRQPGARTGLPTLVELSQEYRKLSGRQL